MDRNIVIFDLDGTLADIQHRRHLVESKPKQWREFYAACPGDRVNAPVAVMFDRLRDTPRSTQVWIVSGRSDEVRVETEDWLKRHCLWPDKIIMRKAGDKTADDVLKRSWLHNGTIPKERVLCVFDDRSKVVKMWREEGLTCFQVAEGDF